MASRSSGDNPSSIPVDSHAPIQITDNGRLDVADGLGFSISGTATQNFTANVSLWNSNSRLYLWGGSTLHAVGNYLQTGSSAQLLAEDAVWNSSNTDTLDLNGLNDTALINGGVVDLPMFLNAAGTNGSRHGALDCTGNMTFDDATIGIGTWGAANPSNTTTTDTLNVSIKLTFVVGDNEAINVETYGSDVPGDKWTCMTYGSVANGNTPTWTYNGAWNAVTSNVFGLASCIITG